MNFYCQKKKRLTLRLVSDRQKRLIAALTQKSRSIGVLVTEHSLVTGTFHCYRDIPLRGVSLFSNGVCPYLIRLNHGLPVCLALTLFCSLWPGVDFLDTLSNIIFLIRQKHNRSRLLYECPSCPGIWLQLLLRFQICAVRLQSLNG